MDRRQLFLSTAKAALASALGGSWLSGAAKAQAATPSAGAQPPTPPSVAPVGQNIGAPDGTRTILGDVLPAPDLPFGGKIELNAVQSQSWWPPQIVPPAGAPNILLIMTDDVGFAAPSTFGGVIPTPT